MPARHQTSSRLSCPSWCFDTIRYDRNDTSAIGRTMNSAILTGMSSELPSEKATASLRTWMILRKPPRKPYPTPSSGIVATIQALVSWSTRIMAADRTNGLSLFVIARSSCL